MHGPGRACPSLLLIFDRFFEDYPNMSRIRPSCRLLKLLLLSLLLGLAVTAQSAEPLSADGGTKWQKVIARDGLLERTQPGVTLWHDYGAFGLYKVSDSALAKLPVAVRNQLRIDAQMDTIGFDRHPIDTAAGEPQLPALLVSKTPVGSGLQLIQFVGPIKQDWLDAVQATGATPVQYVANNAYMVWADGNSRPRLDGLAQAGDFVQYSHVLQPANKVGASIEQRIVEAREPDQLVPVVIQMYRHADKKTSQQRIAGLATRVLSDWSPVLAFENTIVEVRAGDLLTIAGLPDVVWVGERFPRELMDEVQGQIIAGNFNGTRSGPSGPGYKAWLDGLGFSQNPADYPIVNVTDDGVGNGTTTNGAGDVTLTRLGDGVTSRIAYANNCTNDSAADGRGGHGHINTSIISGYDQRSGFPFLDPNGYLRGQGINPYGRSGNTKIFKNSGSYNVSACGGTDAGVIKREQDSGALISSNSWGCSGCSGTYDESSQAYDVGVRDADPSEAGHQPMIYVFSAGNSGPGANTIGTPGNGKNMITVGASENQRPNDESGNWTDGCGVGPTGADNAMDVIDFSSRGPAPGGRIKPETIAPGTHIQGTASTAAGYAGGGVCDQYRPGSQTVFAASSGTSHSAPAVAGVTSLYYRWLQTIHGISAPSPALMKAYLLAHPTYLTGTYAGGNLPTNSQGYGMPDMSTAFDTTPRSLLDQTHVFDNSGETWGWAGAVADPSKPLRIVLNYTDAAGNIGTSPQVNNLNLTVTVNGNTYLGNRFSGQWSTTGGSADNANNYEAVFLPAGTTGPLQITVTAFNIAGDGVPGSGDGTDQDFALVCYNCAQDPDYTLAATPVTQDICAPSAASYDIDVGSILGYTSQVTLGLSGNPAGTTAGFSANPVTPAGVSTLTIGNTGAAVAGSYTMSLSGTSVSGNKSMDLGLNLFTAAPVATTLASPANGAPNVPTIPTFTWNAPAQAATYSIQVASDAGFSNVVASASGLSGTSWTSNVTLNISSTYYWRVWADNICGVGAYSATASFTTVAAPGDCGPGTTPNVLQTTTFEAGLGSWAQGSGGTGINTWAISSSNPHAGAQHVHADNPGAVSDQRLVSSAVTLPSGENPVVLKFWHVPNMENSSATACWDGGILEVSSNGGSSWTQVPNASLLVGGYSGAISGSYGNPLAGLQGWCGGTSYMQTIADVSAYAGQSVQFRYRLGSDTSVSKPGWDLDDVTVQSCAASAPNIAVSPASLSSIQALDTSSHQTLMIGNTGTVDLNWAVAEEPGNGGTCSSPADVAWLSVTPTSGTTVGAGSTPLTVTLDSTGLAAGSYNASLCVTSDDPDTGPGNGTNLVVVPVSLEVDASMIFRDGFED